MTGKIIVVCYFDIVINDLKGKAKSLGFDESCIEFVQPDKFDLSKLFDNRNYLDLIVGKTPHHMKGVKGNSIFKQIEANQKHYPKLHSSTRNHMTLKLSVSDFVKFLLDSDFYKINQQEIESNKKQYEQLANLKQKEPSKAQQAPNVVSNKVRISNARKKHKYGKYLSQLKN